MASKTYRFLGPYLGKVSASGGITYNNTFTVRFRGIAGPVTWTDLQVNDQKTTDDPKIQKVLDVHPNWEEVVV